MSKAIYIRAALLRSAVHIAAYDPGKAVWKLDDKGNLVKGTDGNPIFVLSDGSETSVGGDTIGRLNNEAKTHREAKEKAEATLKKYEGLDPDAARKALDTVSKIDQKKLLDAGEVDRVKAEIAGQYTAQIAEKDKAVSSLQGTLDSMRLATAFSQSDFVRDHIAIPAEIFQGHFAKNFKVEEGKVVPYDSTGNKLFSKKRAGEIADFEEAISMIVDTYPHKNTIMKANTGSGSGNNGNGGRSGAGVFVQRADFEKMNPAEQANVALKAGKGELTIV